ncbi:ParB/RepB/Spo0J family partition protein [Rhodobacter maris]|uniref:ParB family chromosome partitioning protein n=1 Tax=Rhodobacter maris TaxID=446682 RepID=A0A285TAW0_9RHOB|nr:ParB N-terminal domain-containing protein [Rhodobacter maris]SOC16718.1 ParB family chromosome partitioning protein [Rhodobacter maris]
MKKRRTFDIDLPEEEQTFPAGKDQPPSPAPRRSPMAAAISENAEALRDRRALEDRIRAENDALAAEHVRMKRLGLIVDMVALEAIDCWKLVRDRAKGDDLELAELVASIRDIGLSNPIRVEAREDGRFELVQGFRRLAAYRALLAETGDAERWGRIPAGILPRGEDLEGLYRRMVDENLVRKDISFAEMAMLALNYARDPQTAESDADRAVAELFKSAGYQKRSYIRQFIRVMDRLGDDLRFAPHIPRALGLKLAAAIEERPELVAQISAVLRDWENRSVADELEVLRKAAGQEADAEGQGALPVGTGAAKARPAARAKTTFQVASPLGAAKCTAANGRLEIKLDRDFSALDRRKLEAALIRLLGDIA